MDSVLKTKLLRRLRQFALIGLTVAAVLTSRWWWPYLDRTVDTLVGRNSEQSDSAAAEEEHDHDHHDSESSIHLTVQARRNLGLTEEYVRPVQLQEWKKTISVPAIVIEQPGCAHWNVSAPMTGIVTRVNAVPGETVEPGAVLFEMRLTHEELVRTQVEFVQSLGELDVELRELERLRDISQSGAIAGKAYLERQYARDKLQALIQAQRESLRLHGLSERQVDRIAQERTLLQNLQIVAPATDAHDHRPELRLSDNPLIPDSHVLTDSEDEADELAQHQLLAMEQLSVHTGETVDAGQEMCVLVGLDHLYVEGLAFEHDAGIVMQALEQGWTVDAVPDGSAAQSAAAAELQIARVASEIDLHSRSLKFYLPLPNEVVRDTTDAEGRRFVSWKYRPGQRMTLRLPVEVLTEQLVVPEDAVVIDGPEAFVYLQNGDHFDEIPVHVLHRDGANAVLASDGSVFPGDVIAMKSAHRLRMAIRNQTGGGDAGHHGHMH